jgi:SAM-dependent methyltransferase
MMESIFAKYQGSVYEGTDKGVTHSYITTYERLFAPQRHDPIRLLEIGICTGGSLMAWAEYFTSPESLIVGLDVTFDHLVFDFSSHSRIRAHLMDARVQVPPDGPFDFIIDDGSHYLNDQVRSFLLLKNHLKPGGLYIIEDVYTEDEALALLRLGKMHGFSAEFVDVRQAKGRWDDMMIVFTASTSS